MEQINEEDEESIQHEEDNYESVYININRNKEKLDEFQIGIEGGNEKPKIYFSKKILEKVSLHKYNFRNVQTKNSLFKLLYYTKTELFEKKISVLK